MSAVLDKNGKPMRLVAATNTTPLADAKAKPVRVCNCPNHVIGIAEYMVTEMKRNPFSEEGKKITEANAYDVSKEMKAWNALPWYGKLGGPPDYASISASQKLAAYTIWAERVGPHRPWDHKPILAKRLKEQHISVNGGWHRYGDEDYYYDIWSNIHYGYVGAACGFSRNELLGGAGLAQAGSDLILTPLTKKTLPTYQYHPENGAFANKFDDIPDHISIKVGADLYARAKPDVLTVSILLKTIAGVPIPWGKGLDRAKRPHECPK